MAVPPFEQFLYPFLEYLKDGEKTTKQMREHLIEHFNLSDEDIQAKTKSGNTTKLNDRIGWSRQYFRRALFIDIPKFGTYKLTDRATEYLLNHTSLTIDDLMEYPEYATYNTARKKKVSSSCSEIPDIEFTPTEQLEQAFESIEKDLASDLLTKVMEQSPAFFEQLVVDLLLKMGYGGSFQNSAKVTPLSHDGGIDGIIDEDKLGLDKIYIQAKKWSNLVGEPLVGQFVGSLAAQKATKGVFITTSSFTKKAYEYIQKIPQKVALINGEELVRYMIEYNVGVSTKRILEMKRIDSDYFEE